MVHNRISTLILSGGAFFFNFCFGNGQVILPPVVSKAAQAKSVSSLFYLRAFVKKKGEKKFCHCVNLKFHESFAFAYIFYARACFWASISLFYEFLTDDKNVFNFCNFPGISV